MEVKELKKILTERQDFITPSAFTEKYGIKFSHHDGKMAGFDSLSTSCKENPFCQRNMAIAGSICEDCFSDDLLNCRKSLSKVLENNYNILTTLEIPVEEWPLINMALFRIESFGDLFNTIQAQNYLHFIMRNPDTHFAWWSKSPHIILQALEKEGYDVKKKERPQNCTFIVSSIMKNREVGLAKWQKAFYFIDKEFTVYTLEWLVENNKDASFINCGARKCLECKNCYLNKGDKQVRELRK